MMFVSMGQNPGDIGFVGLPPTRGRQYSAEGGFLSAARLATDAIGTFHLELTNVVVGSRVHIEKQSDGVVFDDQVAASTTLNLSLSAYPAGSANNNLRIKVRNASGTPAYRPYETLTTALAGSTSIYVSQIQDE